MNVSKSPTVSTRQQIASGALLIGITLALALWQLFGFSYTLKWDAMDITMPWRYFSIDVLRHGALPLWNPYQFQGFAHGTIPETWYPVGLLCGYLRGYGLYSLNTEYLLHLAIAAIGVFQLARTLGLKHSAAIWAALIFPLSGFFIGNAQHTGWIVAGAWIPHIAASYLRFGRRSHWQEGAWFVIAFFCMLSGGYIAYSIVMVYILVIYTIYRWIRSLNSDRTQQIHFWQHLQLALVTITACAVIITGLYDLKTLIDRSSGLAGNDALVGSFYFKHLISLILPYLTVKGSYAFWHADQSLMNIYMGLPGLLLLLLSMGKWRHPFYRNGWLFILIFLMLSLGKELPVRSWFNVLPGFDLFRLPSLFRYFCILGGVLIAARLISDLDHGTNQKELRLLPKLIVFLSITLIIVLIILIAKDPSLLKSVFQLDLPGIKHAAAFQIFIQLFWLGSLWVLLRRYPASWFRILLFISALDLVIATQLNARVSVFSEAAIASVEDCIPQQPKGFPVPVGEDPLITNKDKNLASKFIYRNTNTLYKRIGSDGYTPYQYQTFIDLEKSPFYEQSLQWPYLFLSLYHPKPDSSNYYIADYDPFITREELEVISFHPNRIELVSKTDVLRLLVYNQNYHNGWKAFANGKPIPSVRINQSLLGFILPEGQHQIDLTFSPGNLINTAYISAALLLGIVFLLWISALISQPRLVMSLTIIATLFSLLAYQAPRKHDMPKLASYPVLINQLDERDREDSIEKHQQEVIQDRFLDHEDLERFIQTVDNMPKPFLYVDRAICPPQSGAFIKWLQQHYQVTDTLLSTTAYRGWLCQSADNDGENVLLFSSLQSFENHQSHWMESEQGIITGADGNRFQDLSTMVYGATYEHILQNEVFMEEVIVDLQIRAMESKQAQIVCHIEDMNGNQVIWQSYAPQLSASQDWQRQVWNLTLEQNLAAGSKLRIYIWNPEKESFQVDKIRVKGLGK